ncbi:MAG: uracil-DNA glycosylase [Pseudomonadales bacterium]|nr:uracil-DNA glycosylase [Pseudomonadales bacterium]
MPKITAFVQSLQDMENTSTVYNPYLIQDFADNLEKYLRSMQKQKGRHILLVGEAPGYRGCRHTGIPFSSSYLFQNSHHPFISRLGKRIQLHSESKETTAQIVWDYLLKQELVPLFWNAYPFHPHLEGNELSNRSPKKAEIIKAMIFLKMLGEIFNVEKVASLGRAGSFAAENTFPHLSIRYIRHPSYGGKKDFVQGMNAFLR